MVLLNAILQGLLIVVITAGVFFTLLKIFGIVFVEEVYVAPTSEDIIKTFDKVFYDYFQKECNNCKYEKECPIYQKKCTCEISNFVEYHQENIEELNTKEAKK